MHFIPRESHPAIRTSTAWRPWTRRPFDQGERHALTVEVARDAGVRQRRCCRRCACRCWRRPTGRRALVGGLLPARQPIGTASPTHSGAGSRVGIAARSPRRAPAICPVRFAFVVSNSVNEGARRTPFAE